MQTYIAKSGQNIFDIALTIYGSIEGVFDLLISNSWLTYDTPIKAGMTIEYHNDFVINSDIVRWFQTNGVVPKNGHHSYSCAKISDVFSLWLYTYRAEEYDRIAKLPVDERNAYLEKFSQPRILIQQVGSECSMSPWLMGDTYIVVDWGDYSAPQIIGYTGDEQELSHCYNGNGNHIIRVYGNFSLHSLDLSLLNGIYYLLDTVRIDHIEDPINIPELQTLINN